MSGPASFDASRYVLRLADGEEVTLEPLPAGEAPRLGDAIATMDPWHAYGYPASALARMLGAHEAGAPRLAFVMDGRIVGAAIIRAAWLRGPYLQFLALLPEAQGRSIGAAFLRLFEAESRAADERNLWVVASQINTGAIRFYEGHGFEKVADLDGLAYDGRTEFLFRKRLV
jgi:ribosomal protein S18 acetylase RimI-like enzyme